MGPSDDPEIERLRGRQIRNFFALNLLAPGTPMILMGDEGRRTQLGNNNAYCQDSEVNWLDWTLLERHRDLHRFVRELIRLRLGRELATAEHGLTLNQLLHQARIQWHGVRLGEPDWGDDSHSIACTLRSMSGRSIFHLMISAYWEPLSFALPEPPRGHASGWRRLIDTAQPSPADIAEPEAAALIVAGSYSVEPRSIVLLYAPQGSPV